VQATSQDQHEQHAEKHRLFEMVQDDDDDLGWILITTLAAAFVFCLFVLEQSNAMHVQCLAAAELHSTSPPSR
jgi:hypothetical protein